jgi:hypothetical protein
MTYRLAERVGFVPGERVHINDLGPFSLAQIARNTQTLSIRYKAGTAQCVVETRPRRQLLDRLRMLRHAFQSFEAPSSSSRGGRETQRFLASKSLAESFVAGFFLPHIAQV